MKLRAVFYYGHIVTPTSNTIRIDEGSGNIDVELQVGRYSLTDYIAMVSREINAVTTQDYIVALDRKTRQVTISAASDFDLLVADIYPLNSGFPILGFNEIANLTGSNSYASDTATGRAYFPQFPLQNYIDFSANKEYLDASINKTAQGKEEVVSFGLVEYAEFDIRGITDHPMIAGSPIENNPNGVSDAKSFMDYCISKGELEFMPDREDRESYSRVLLQKTSKNSKGVGYQLAEDRRVSGYFSTKSLKFKRT